MTPPKAPSSCPDPRPDCAREFGVIHTKLDHLHSDLKLIKRALFFPIGGVSPLVILVLAALLFAKSKGWL